MQNILQLSNDFTLKKLLMFNENPVPFSSYLTTNAFWTLLFGIKTLLQMSFSTNVLDFDYEIKSDFSNGKFVGALFEEHDKHTLTGP